MRHLPRPALARTVPAARAADEDVEAVGGPQRSDRRLDDVGATVREPGLSPGVAGHHQREPRLYPLPAAEPCGETRVVDDQAVGVEHHVGDEGLALPGRLEPDHPLARRPPLQMGVTLR
jgi:hypothetical protein